ncbi:MAG: phosphocarrier protein HPr [Bacteroidota bacterium]|nr:phosphocarrier protein HPr [Bacteroidota bacterium]
MFDTSLMLCINILGLEMLEKELTVVNRAGLHTRPAASLVRLTSKFKSDIQISRETFKINAKSIIGVMSLVAEKGCKLILNVNGEDESQAAEEISNLFETGFGE